ncbi:MAG TPA: SpoIIE family protein phosphatase [Actinocrinis sp.]|nr:SpoIIE family protein phosphatase [Actinocrinis sp.]
MALPGPAARPNPAPSFAAALEDSAEDLYENAPCGYLSTQLDGLIVKANGTLLDWLGRTRPDLVGRLRFSDLLTVGGKLYHETHFAPLLQMQGEVGGVALELKAADGTRLPVLVTSVIKNGPDGSPLLIRTTVFDARDRRAYETELLRARQEADAARAQAETAREEAERARQDADTQREAAEQARLDLQRTDLEVRRDRDRLERFAATLQRSLLPPVLPPVPGMQVAAYYHIASLDHVGGDFYDLFPLTGDTWGFFLGDVCGKGAVAAAVTSLVRYTLRAAAVYEPNPAAVLTNLNTALTDQYRNDDLRFCTVVFGLITLARDGTDCTVVLASGGHPPALLLRADGTAAYQHTPGGQLIGALPEALIATTAIALRPGDTLVLYTDGLTEAHTIAPDRYGEQALLDFAADLAPTDAPAAVTALTGLLAGFGDGLDDDTALMALSLPAKSTTTNQGTG